MENYMTKLLTLIITHLSTQICILQHTLHSHECIYVHLSRIYRNWQLSHDSLFKFCFPASLFALLWVFFFTTNERKWLITFKWRGKPISEQESLPLNPTPIGGPFLWAYWPALPAAIRSPLRCPWPVSAITSSLHLKDQMNHIWIMHAFKDFFKSEWTSVAR